VSVSTPVVVIVFNRPEKTKRILEEIVRARPAKLYVIADGPREKKAGEAELVNETRKLVEEFDWKCEVVRIYSNTNLGLRERVLTGLDEVFSRENSAIILEDDCLPNGDFFTFSTQLLDKYSAKDSVALVSGNNFASNARMVESYYFSTQANIWGWASWARTWQEFRVTKMDEFLTGSAQAEIAKAIPSRFHRASFMSLLRASRELDSWAIQFAAFCFVKGRLSVVPKVNLVSNIGFGAESTHTKFESYADEVKALKLDFPLRHPTIIGPNTKEMRRESRIKLLRWFTYPLAHPIDFLGRVIRYLRLRFS
jgi:hypothetical protein